MPLTTVKFSGDPISRISAERGSLFHHVGALLFILVNLKMLTSLSVRRRKVAFGALAVGAVAIGAFAIGALAIGSLAVGRLAIGKGKAGKLNIDELTISRLRVHDLIVTGSLALPKSPEA